MGVTVALCVLPWLALAPIANGAVAVALFACTLVAAFHGWGIALARSRGVEPLRAIQWGIATVIGIAGIAIALGCYTSTIEAAIVFTGAAIHTVAVATHRRRPSLAAWSFWIVPVALLAVVGVLAIVGGAGDFAARPFDDDGNVLGELRRLADTGALGDPIGYPRAFQLGGHVALAALANVAGDPRLLRMLEGLGLVLALACAIRRIGPRDAHGALWATLVVIAASAVAIVAEPTPLWLGVGLMLALFDTDTPDIPLGVVAGALIALRLAYAPLAIVGIVWGTRGDRRRMLIAAAAMLAVIAPYLVSIARAALSVPAAARAMLPASTSAGKLAIAAAITLALIPLLVVALRELRGLAFASAAGLAGIAAQLTGDHALRFAWAIAIACMLALAIELARRPQSLQPVAMFAALILCVLIYDGQDASGRAGWYRRTAELVDSVGYLAHSSIAPPRDLDAILDAVPADAVIALWLPEPERLDHARHRLVDVRTPRLARLRDHRFDGKPPELEALLAALGARYVLLAPDDAALQRRMQLPPGAACAKPSPQCADGLDLVARHYATIATRDGLQLVDLGVAARTP